MTRVAIYLEVCGNETLTLAGDSEKTLYVEPCNTCTTYATIENLKSLYSSNRANCTAATVTLFEDDAGAVSWTRNSLAIINETGGDFILQAY